MKLLLIITLSLVSGVTLYGQDKSLPYYEIPDYPGAYTATTVTARLIDGVGFRYYWATQGLREKDLKYRPSKEARSSMETLVHIYALSCIIVNSVNSKANTGAEETQKLSFPELREKTLNNFKETSDHLKAGKDSDLDNDKIIFKGDSTTVSYPFWNQLNGPIADALWHIGQVVSFRRSSGNPYNANAEVFTGKVTAETK